MAHRFLYRRGFRGAVVRRDRAPSGRGYFTTIFCAASLGAFLAPTIETLAMARFAQGIGASAGVANSRAIVRDCFQGDESSQIMHLISIILVVGPAVSPTIGGFLVLHIG